MTPYSDDLLLAEREWRLADLAACEEFVRDLPETRVVERHGFEQRADEHRACLQDIELMLDLPFEQRASLHEPAYAEDINQTYGIGPRKCESDGDELIEIPKHEHDWVGDRIAVGCGVCNANDIQTLFDSRITHVVDCRMYPTFNGNLCANPSVIYDGTTIKYVHCPTNDPGLPKTPAYFKPGVDFALEALKEPRARILVNCDQGINRSSSMAYAILRMRGMTANEAEYAIRSARPMVGLAFMPDAERAIQSWK